MKEMVRREKKMMGECSEYRRHMRIFRQIFSYKVNFDAENVIIMQGIQGWLLTSTHTTLLSSLIIGLAARPPFPYLGITIYRYITPHPMF